MSDATLVVCAKAKYSDVWLPDDRPRPAARWLGSAFVGRGALGCVLWVTAVGAFTAFTPSTHLRAQEQSLESAAWLAGCWRLESPTRLMDEQWMAPAGGAMVGMSRSVRDSRMRGFELVRIVQRDRGLVYIAMPSGQTQAEFPATVVTERQLVFENPEHDFPKRIEYLMNGADSLLANVSADGEGFQLRMGRMPCDV